MVFMEMEKWAGTTSDQGRGSKQAERVPANAPWANLESGNVRGGPVVADSRTRKTAGLLGAGVATDGTLVGGFNEGEAGWLMRNVLSRSTSATRGASPRAAFSRPSSGLGRAAFPGFRGTARSGL